MKERKSRLGIASELPLSVAQHPQTQLAGANSTFSISFLILSGSTEEKDPGFLLGTKNQAIDGIKHLFTMCACGEGLTNDSNVAKAMQSLDLRCFGAIASGTYSSGQLSYKLSTSHLGSYITDSCGQRKRKKKIPVSH